MNLRVIQLIAMRDFWAIVQTKSFLLGLLAFAFIASVMPGVLLLATISDVYRVGVVDPLGAYHDGLSKRFEDGKTFEVIDLKAQAAPVSLKEHDLFALIEVLPSEDGAEERFHISTVNLADPEPHQDLRNVLTSLLREERAKRLDVSPEALRTLMKPLTYETLLVHPSKASRSADEKDFVIATALPFIIVFSLFGLISFQSERLLTALMEEKMKRLLEVILTRATIYEVLLGKMLGILYVGLILFGGVALLIGSAAYLLAELFGAQLVIQTKIIAYYSLSYVLGYYLYAGFYASIGASCGNPKDAENLSMPLRMLLVIPIMISVYVNRNPEATASVFFSYFPLTSPFVMTNRMVVSEVPWSSLLGSSAIVVVSGTIGLWVAAQIFRASLLAQGRTLCLRDITAALRKQRPVASTSTTP